MKKEMNTQRLNWVSIIFLSLSSALVLICVPWYLWQNGFSWPLLLLTFVFYALTGFSITMGYHRLFSHRAYEANSFVKVFLLFFGAAALQNSCLAWSIDHRRHHKDIDTEDDPYNIHKGFLWAHLIWLMFKANSKYSHLKAKDLENDFLVRFQDKYYLPIAIASGFLLPALIAHFFFDAFWGGLLFGAFLRLHIVYHSTWFINSFCHMWGRQPYNKMNSARDNFFIAFFTFGEGYHNFHHKFPSDYRNAIKWWQFDPSKWFIKGLNFLGFTRNLKKTTAQRIALAALEGQEKQVVHPHIENLRERLNELKIKIDQAQGDFEKYKLQLRTYRKKLNKISTRQKREFKVELQRKKNKLDLLQKEFYDSISLYKMSVPVYSV